ncbi:MAG: glycosyltransferase [Dehalococcoidia bacterium]|nr:glycosyltransferase [Dehalococcoidia bacterium]
MPTTPATIVEEDVPAGRSAPSVTIGLPVYNGELFVAQAIESVLSQSFADWELVICDNASTDGTERICRAYAARDSRIRYVRNSTNLGAARNFRRALGEARGEYFKWLAADDYLAPAFLERAVAALEAHPGAVLAHADALFVDPSGVELYPSTALMELRTWPGDAVERTELLVEMLIRTGMVAMLTIFGLARTDALRAVRPMANYHGADWMIVAELATRGQFLVLPEQLVFYRRHERSSSTGDRWADANVQQEFYDPAVRGSLRRELQQLRRFAALPVAILRSPLPLRARVRLAAKAAFLGARLVAHERKVALRRSLRRATRAQAAG